MNPASSTNRLRALWVYKVFDVGGAERLLVEVHPYLRDAVEIIPAAVAHADGEMAAVYRSLGLSPISLGSRHDWDIFWLLTLRAVVERTSPDIIHFHAPYPAALGRLALRSRNLPVVYTEHSVWENYRRLTRFANMLTYPLNDAAMAVSRGVRESQQASPLARWLTRRTEVVPNGVDVEALYATASPTVGIHHPCYGCVGHLRTSKGIDVLLRAAAHVRKRVPGVQGYVVGTGEEEDSLRELKRQIAADDVELLGYRYDARSITRMLDVFVVPSRHEGLPIALLEAMALGRPIVATRVGGIPEAIHDGASGLLVEPDDPVALGEAVATLLMDPVLARRLGDEARRVALQLFSAEATAHELLRIYRSVVQETLPS